MIKFLVNLPKNIFAYAKNTWAELRRVNWLKPRQVLNLTMVVLVVAVGLTLLILGIDWVFVNARNFLFNIV